MKEVFIFGHKKPDTDSVTASIALANLKQSLGIPSRPMILGKINDETKFVLRYFNIETPEYLEDVKLQIKDLNYYKNCSVNEYRSIKAVYDYMNLKNVTGVPIVDNESKFKGLLTSKILNQYLLDSEFTSICSSYDNILDVLEGEKILKCTDEVKGNLLLPNFKNSLIYDYQYLNSDTIMIVDDRKSFIESAVNNKIKLLILANSLDIQDNLVDIARINKVSIIKTKKSLMHVIKVINSANYINTLIENTRNIYFKETDYYDDFKEQCLKLGYNNYPVIGDNSECLGLIRITDIDKLDRKKVILVDHNEANQSVEGLDEANILEVIDHHKIDTLSTNMPINFRNMTVGSTNTIIYLMYREASIDIPKNISGIMLAGIISDTLKFTSPTTTEYDREASTELSLLADIDIDKFSDEMFKAGTNLKDKTLIEIIDSDMKIFTVSNKRIAISQVVTLNSEDILKKKDEYIKELDEIKKNREFDVIVLCVTDLIKNGSYIFFDQLSHHLIEIALNNQNVYEGYFIDKCLSRKKQLIPLIMNAIR